MAHAGGDHDSVSLIERARGNDFQNCCQLESGLLSPDFTVHIPVNHGSQGQQPTISAGILSMPTIVYMALNLMSVIILPHL